METHTCAHTADCYGGGGGQTRVHTQLIATAAARRRRRRRTADEPAAGELEVRLLPEDVHVAEGDLRARTHAHTNTHARAHGHTHTHTHTSKYTNTHSPDLLTSFRPLLAVRTTSSPRELLPWPRRSSASPTCGRWISGGWNRLFPPSSLEAPESSGRVPPSRLLRCDHVTGPAPGPDHWRGKSRLGSLGLPDSWNIGTRIRPRD